MTTLHWNQVRDWLRARSAKLAYLFGYDAASAHLFAFVLYSEATAVDNGFRASTTSDEIPMLAFAA